MEELRELRQRITEAQNRAKDLEILIKVSNAAGEDTSAMRAQYMQLMQQLVRWDQALKGVGY